MSVIICFLVYPLQLLHPLINAHCLLMPLLFPCSCSLSPLFPCSHVPMSCLARGCLFRCMSPLDGVPFPSFSCLFSVEFCTLSSLLIRLFVTCMSSSHSYPSRRTLTAFITHTTFPSLTFLVVPYPVFSVPTFLFLFLHPSPLQFSSFHAHFFLVFLTPRRRLLLDPSLSLLAPSSHRGR